MGLLRTVMNPTEHHSCYIYIFTHVKYEFNSWIHSFILTRIQTFSGCQIWNTFNTKNCRDRFISLIMSIGFSLCDFLQHIKYKEIKVAKGRRMEKSEREKERERVCTRWQFALGFRADAFASCWALRSGSVSLGPTRALSSSTTSPLRGTFWSQPLWPGELQGLTVHCCSQACRRFAFSHNDFLSWTKFGLVTFFRSSVANMVFCLGCYPGKINKFFVG